MLNNLFAAFAKPKSGGIAYLLVGLGNPGLQYEQTRHHAGFLALDYLAEQCGAKVDRMKWSGMLGEAELGGVRVLLLKPMTYMNLSGDCVREVMRFYKLPPERVIVLYDDISLQPGKLRIRLKGSHGGQNGMRSIIEQCGSEAFPRIKLGVGAKPNLQWDLADWVLSKFDAREQKEMEAACKRACEAAELLVQGRAEEAMNRYNG